VIIELSRVPKRAWIPDNFSDMQDSNCKPDWNRILAARIHGLYRINQTKRSQMTDPNAT